MIADDAMAAYFTYMIGHKKALLYLLMLFGIGFDFSTPQGHYLKTFLLLSVATFVQKAVCMIELDSEIMDLRDIDLEDNGYSKELVGL
jgi:hypothetical protein